MRRNIAGRAMQSPLNPGYGPGMGLRTGGDVGQGLMPAAAKIGDAFVDQNAPGISAAGGAMGQMGGAGLASLMEALGAGGGSGLGTALGSALGSVVPGAGTAAGGALGELAGSLSGAAGAAPLAASMGAVGSQMGSAIAPAAAKIAGRAGMAGASSGAKGLGGLLSGGGHEAQDSAQTQASLMGSMPSLSGFSPPQQAPEDHGPDIESAPQLTPPPDPPVMGPGALGRSDQMDLMNMKARDNALHAMRTGKPAAPPSPPSAPPGHGMGDRAMAEQAGMDAYNHRTSGIPWGQTEGSVDQPLQDTMQPTDLAGLAGLAKRGIGSAWKPAMKQLGGRAERQALGDGVQDVTGELVPNMKQLKPTPSMMPNEWDDLYMQNRRRLGSGGMPQR